MRILIIGGTRFLGRHLAALALAGGYDLTLFHRGATGADLFPQARRILGDRREDAGRLAEGEWDAVIDTCAYHPRDLRPVLRAVAGRAERYILISTISVYALDARAPIDEEAPVQRLADPDAAEVERDTYGPLKVACEEALAAGFPGDKVVIRPGLIVGPHDPTDRFTYWPWRLAQDGPYVAPDDPGCPVQFIDARDLADWILALAAGGRTGTFNAVGPEKALKLGAFLKSCREAGGGQAHAVPLTPERIEALGLRPFADLPLWLPEDRQDMHRVSRRRAKEAGLRHRPLADTLADTLAWAQAELATRPLRAGLSAEREAEILAEVAAPS